VSNLQTCKPNLIIPGVMKAGTTSLFYYLSSHPKIFAPKVKEINYFIEPNFSRTEYSAYLDNFRNCTDSYKYSIDVSPRYFFDGSDVAKRIYANLGSTKILIILRNPADLFYSYYKHLKKIGRLAQDTNYQEFALRCLSYFEEDKNLNIQNENERKREFALSTAVSRGIYVTQLREWQKVFPKTMKICFMEEMKANPIAFMSDICSWLDLDSSFYTSFNFRNQNKAYTPKRLYLHNIAVNTSKFLPFSESSFIRELLYRVYRKMNSANNIEEEDKKTRSQLIELYKPYNNELFSYLEEEGYSQFPSWLCKHSS